MDIFTLDFETFYSKEYSLTKMSTEDYIRDPRFRVILVAIKRNDEPTYYVSGRDPALLRQSLYALGLQHNALLAHNTAFDGAILAWQFGIVPKLYLDTKLMARATILPYIKHASLKEVASYLGCGTKGTEVLRALGKNIGDFTEREFAAYARYCVGDVEITYKSWLKLKVNFPPKELSLIDRILRMYIEPVLELDTDILEQHLRYCEIQKQKLLDTISYLGFSKQDLMSNKKFAEVLRELDVSPPLKISPTTGKETFAFAKDDPEFKELEQHSDPRVQAVVAARLGHKSTLEETRTQRLLDIGHRYKKLAVPLLYCGARTTRCSGSEKINLQNLPKRGGSKALRTALIAPEGYKVVAADQAQIEARLLAHIAGQTDLIAQFALGMDVYALFAKSVYGVNEVTLDERFVGKVGILSLGYGAGAKKFQFMLQSYGVQLDIDGCREVVNTYRSMYRNIVAAWNTCELMLRHMCSTPPAYNDTPIVMFDLLPVHEDKIMLPNGLSLHYPYLIRTVIPNEKITGSTYNSNTKRTYVYSGRTYTIYGGKLIENIVQALARIVVMDQLVDVSKHYKVAHTCHDEIVCVVPDSEVDKCTQIMRDIMVIPPSWAPELPLAVEVTVGQNYGSGLGGIEP